MSIQPGSNEPIDALNILNEATMYKNENRLHYYDITNTGLKEKNFFGRCIAWFLNLVGYQTTLHIYIAAATKYAPLIPDNYDYFKERFHFDSLSNLKDIQAVKNLAQNLLAIEKIKGKAMDLEAFTQKAEQDEYEKIKKSLESFTLQIPLPKDILDIEDPIDQFKALLSESLRSDEHLLNQFKIDCHRRGFSIENPSAKSDGHVEIIDHSYKEFYDANQDMGDEERKDSYRSHVDSLLENWVLDHHETEKDIIKNPQSTLEEISQAQNTIDEICKNLKLFLNQTVANNLLTNPENYPDELQNKTVEMALSPASNQTLNEEDEGLAPLNFTCFDKTVLTLQKDTVINESLFTIYDGYGGAPIAKIKAHVSLDLNNHKLTIKPIEEFQITSDCTPKQLQRLAGRFL
jgi:hypothetical protein